MQDLPGRAAVTPVPGARTAYMFAAGRRCSVTTLDRSLLDVWQRRELMRHSSILVFGCSAIVTATLSYSSVSDAFFERRMSAYYCAPSGPQSNTSAQYGGIGVSNFSFTANVTVLCAVAEDTNLRIFNISTLNIHGFDGNSTQGITASVCSQAAFSNGGLCGLTASSGTTFTGNYMISPEREAWGTNFSVDFPYIEVTIPPGGSAGASTVRGYYAAGG